jgi:hypothetical protein
MAPDTSPPSACAGTPPATPNATTAAAAGAAAGAGAGFAAGRPREAEPRPVQAHQIAVRTLFSLVAAAPAAAQQAWYIMWDETDQGCR